MSDIIWVPKTPIIRVKERKLCFEGRSCMENAEDFYNQRFQTIKSRINKGKIRSVLFSFKNCNDQTLKAIIPLLDFFAQRHTAHKGAFKVEWASSYERLFKAGLRLHDKFPCIEVIRIDNLESFKIK